MDQRAFGPLYVQGVQEGVNCGNDAQVTVLCQLDSGQSPLKISLFRMKETREDGAVQTLDMPHTNRFASHFGLRPHGAYREYECRISRPGILDGVAVPGGPLAPVTR